MALTKSLHTVTAAANVARLLHSFGTHENAAALAKAALAVLGYDVDTSPAGCARDVTVDRIVRACAEVRGAP
jgi:hypothetical protein